MSIEMKKLILPDSAGNEQEFEVIDALMRDTLVTPEMFGAKGDGVSDDTASINRCLQNGNKKILFSKSYYITDSLIVTDNTEIIGSLQGKVISGINSLKPIFKCNDCSNIKFDGLIIEGNSQYDAVTDSRDSIEAGLFFGGECSNISIKNCKITKCGQAGIFLKSASHVVIDGCYISYLERIPSGFSNGQNYCFGIRTYTSITDLKISNTEIFDVAIGVYLTHGGSDIEVNNCYVHDITAQHAFYCATSNFNIHDCRIDTILANGINVQYDSSSVVSSDTVIRNNKITDAGNCIAINNIVDTSIVFTDLLIENNIFEKSDTALNCCCVQRLIFKNNIIRLIKRNGIFIVSDKITKECQFIGNYFYNVAQNEVSGYKYGMQLKYIEDCIVKNNIIISDDAKMQYGIYATATATKLKIIGNIIKGASTFSFRIDNATTSVEAFDDNVYDLPINSQIMNVEGIPTKIFAGNSAPSSGYHSRGEIVYNSAPDTGQPIGWVCITAGTVGTWKPFGTILSS